MPLRTLLLIAAILSTCCSLRAQHNDVRPRVDEGQLVTDGHDDDADVTTPDQRVFGYDFGEDSEAPYFASDPGFNSLGPIGLSPGSQLSFSIVSGSGWALPANLTVWDGNDADAMLPGVQVGFSATGGESIELDIDSAVVVGSTLGDQAGLNIPLSGSGAVHRHVAATLGGMALPDPGIYLFALALETSDPAVDDSEPFFLVYNHGLGEALHDAAIDYIQETFVFHRGDMNGDDFVDNFDIQPMEIALANPSTFETLYPSVDNYALRGDINRDGAFDNFDIQPHEVLLAHGGAPAAMVPEPATSSLVLVASVLFGLAGAGRSRLRSASSVQEA